ncbi:hypothetical protein ACP275_12G114200 [Erythranthe tilingii]
MDSSLKIPEITLKSGAGKIPVLGFGTASDSPFDSETTRTAILQAIEIGYRHFDTAALYNSEQPLGEAVAEAINRGLIKSRDELFITSKLWCSDAHGHRVLPALKKTLEDFVAMDFESVWAAMEECQSIGLTKSIGVSNFSCTKLLQILEIAKIQPAVNQVELNPCWQQKKLIEFCKEKGILVFAYSCLGSGGTNRVMESQVLKQISEAKGKTVAQVSLRWGYEQGIGMVVKSFNKERMKQNIDIFDWSLNSEEVDKISEIPQCRAFLGVDYTSVYGPYKTIQQLWDEQI